MASEVLHRLGISESSNEAASLREGVITPDKWRDYPHHHGKERSIEKHIMKARGFFLEDDLTEALFHLGVALHYIQDSYTSLSTRSEHHKRWEAQMDEAYFTDNLHGLVKKAFNTRPDREQEYRTRLKFFTNDVEGKESTVRLATLPPPCAYQETWGKPHVDVNFALRASYLISKSVLAPKRCTRLEEELTNVHKDYERVLKKAEISAADSILESGKKRDEYRERKQQNGFLQRIRNGFLELSSRRHGFEAKRKLGKCKQKKHLRGILKKYEKAAEAIVAPHRYWYDYDVPKIDLDSIEKELLSIKEASEYLKASEEDVRELTAKNKIPCHRVENEEFVRKSELIKQA